MSQVEPVPHDDHAVLEPHSSAEDDKGGKGYAAEVEVAQARDEDLEAAIPQKGA